MACLQWNASMAATSPPKMFQYILQVSIIRQRKGSIKSEFRIIAIPAELRKLPVS